MEITTIQRPDGRVELALKGRLDGYWSDHLAKHLQEVIRLGARGVWLDLSDVGYISSMGLRVLVENYKTLAGIQGTFGVMNPSPQVTTVLRMTGLLDQLTKPAAIAPVEEDTPAEILERGSTLYEVHAHPSAKGFRCTTIGEPGLLTSASYNAGSCRQVAFPASTLAVGLGAFGNSFEDSRPRFGEFLAAGGAAAYQPTDDSNVADYLLTHKDLIPEVQVLNALRCEGDFTHSVRFNANGERGVGLSSIAAECLELVGADHAAVAIAAEASGLVGASLRKPPVESLPVESRKDTDIFAHHEIRQWISFSPEQVHARTMVLVVGVVSRSTNGELGTFLRPIGKLHGHFHGAAFSYQPLKRGKLDFVDTVTSLFNAAALEGVLHLLYDDRDANGAGESEFVRGACWLGPITAVSKEATA
ncbi:MAG: STAS domain-containing protein [Bryobacteraceae bacterium]